MLQDYPKPTLAVYKFTSCDGCQLAFLNAGVALLELTNLITIIHFAEAGFVAPTQAVDIAFVEGSISTLDEITRIQQIRAQSNYLITIGACATAGGIQALRNFAGSNNWLKDIYATSDTIDSLKTSYPISHYVKVDTELWGCPVNTAQVMVAIRSLLFNAAPQVKRDSVCMDCKRRGRVCILVSQQQSCMGPVTQTGCGSLCPGLNRACYGCYGPSENPNTQSLGAAFKKLGLSDVDVARQFHHINNQAPAFHQAGNRFKTIPIWVA